MPKSDLSIVVPAYNESKRLPETLRQLIAFCNDLEITWEVVIVVEKSEDQTLDLAKAAAASQANFRVLAPKIHRGKGAAVREGILASIGEIILFMDADLSVPLVEVTAFFRYFINHPETDVLVGSRKH